jgi:hypothetical protein
LVAESAAGTEGRLTGEVVTATAGLAHGPVATDDDIGAQGVTSAIGGAWLGASEGPFRTVSDLGAGETRRGEGEGDDTLHSGCV